MQYTKIKPKDPSDPSTNFSSLPESKQNDLLRFQLFSKKPHRFHNYNCKNWYCNNCSKTIHTNDVHYHCFECPDYDLCETCFQTHSHNHGGTDLDFFHKLHEPNWFFTDRLKEGIEKGSLLTNDVIDKCFKYYSERKYIGYRKSVNDSYEYMSFSDVHDQAMLLAGGLKEIGVKNGDFIGVIGEVCVEYVVIMYACIFGGYVFLPIQTILKNDEKEYIFKQTEVKVLFTVEKYQNDILSVQMKCRHLRNILLIPEGYKNIIKRGNESEMIKPYKYKKDDILTVIYTSGTTNFPKGIVFRQESFLIEISRQNKTNPLVTMSFLPYSHISGLSDLLVGLFNGGRLNLVTNGDMKNLFTDFKDVRPTVLSTIPRILNHVYNEYHILCKTEEKDDVKKKMKNVFGDRLLEIVVGSAKCSSEVKTLIRELCEIPVYDGYGISEVGTVSFNYQKQGKVKYKLIDCPELGYFKTAQPYPQGELLVQNELTSTLEYFKNEEETKKRFDEDGFFHTGDIVELRDNDIFLIDRKHNIIKMQQGEFVSLEKIENVLETSKLIDMILVCANPSKTKLVGIVIPIGGGKSVVTKKEILKDIVKIGKSKKFSPWEFPRNVHIVKEEFQLTELKKKNRRKIMKQYEKEIFSMFSKDEVTELITNYLQITDINRHMTFKELGGDSLTGTLIVQEMKSKGKNISYDDLMNKSIKDIVGTLNIGNLNNQFVSIEKEKKKFRMLKNQLSQKYQLETIDGHKKDFKNIFITGVTGFVGKNLLVSLLMNFPKSNIYCLIREGSIGVNTKSNTKIHKIVGDLSQKFFGLSEKEFFELSDKIDVIIHVGAMVNHFLSYKDHYGSNVSSLYEIIKLAHGWKPIIYISSLSVYSGFPPKDTIDEEKHKHMSGYAASKWVADTLLTNYYKNHIILRLTLTIGSISSGMVNLKDWFYRIVSAMIDFQLLPDEEKLINKDIPFDMISVDHVVKSIINSMKTKQFGKQYNVSYENVSLKEIIHFVERYLGNNSKEVKKLSFVNWITEMEKKCYETNHPLKPFIGGIKKNKLIGYSKFYNFNCKNYFHDLLNGEKIEKMNYEQFKLSIDEINKNNKK